MSLRRSLALVRRSAVLPRCPRGGGLPRWLRWVLSAEASQRSARVRGCARTTLRPPTGPSGDHSAPGTKPGGRGRAASILLWGGGGAGAGGGGSGWWRRRRRGHRSDPLRGAGGPAWMRGPRGSRPASER